MSLNLDRARKGYLFPASDGKRMYTREWMPEGEPKAFVLLLHGCTEHSGRYEHVANYLNGQGFAVLAYDLRGHGKSPGRPVYFSSFDDHVADARCFAQWVQTTHHPKCPVFLLGSSMGGLIWTLAAIEQPELARGLVLSSALFKLGDDFSPLRVFGAKVLSHVLPWFPVAPMRVKNLSRDKNEVEKYVNDPLVYHRWIRAATGAAISRAVEDLENKAALVKLPLLAMHGTEDQITAPEGSVDLAQKATCKNNQHQLFEGCYHLLFVEQQEQRQEVLDCMVSWLDKQMTAAVPAPKYLEQKRGVRKSA